MSAHTGISWCDSTFNPVIGCDEVSTAAGGGGGCDNCYARELAKRYGWAEWGPDKARLRTGATNWKLPERWNRTEFVQCAACGHRGEDKIFHRQMIGSIDSCCPACEGSFLMAARRRVFSASLSDWLDNKWPIEWLVDFLDLVRRTPNLDWLLLTKRIGNWRTRLTAARKDLVGRSTGDLCAALRSMSMVQWIDEWLGGMAPANVWLGATVVNQAEAERDVPKLLTVPADIRFLSIEPMLGPMDLRNWIGLFPALGASTYTDQQDVERCDLTGTPVDGINWVICGGESGSHARPMHPDWVRTLRDQCADVGVPFHFKQWGEWATIDALPDRIEGQRDNADFIDGEWHFGREDIGGCGSFEDCEPEVWRVGKKAAGRLLDGIGHNAFPVTR